MSSIVCDIDGVLADVSSYLTALNARTGRHHTPAELRNYGGIRELYGEENADAVFRDPQVIGSMPPHTRNALTLRVWGRERERAILLVTRRPREVQIATYMWLEGLGLSPALAAPPFHVRDKERWARSYVHWPTCGDIDVWIDDEPAVCDAVAPLVGAVYMVNRPWNIHVTTRANRINYLDEIALSPRAPAEVAALLAVNAGIRTPKLAGDVGYDLYTLEDYRIRALGGPSGITRVAVGVDGDPLRIAVPEGCWATTIGRSCWMQKGLLVFPSVIDPGYRGPIYLFVTNINEQQIYVARGERVGQLVLFPSTTPPLRITDTLPASERGERGFGSTGR